MISNETKYNQDWDLKKLEDIGKFGRGKSKHRPRDDKTLFGGKYPFIQTGQIKSTTLNLRDYSNTYNDKGLAQSKLWEKGTLCITIAANIAETAVLDINACFPDSIVGFVPNEDKHDAYYMHYVFCYLRRVIQRSVSGSVQDNINLAYLKKLEFRIPELNERKRITKILKNLDEKIEKNSEVNKKLEEMAQAIFKQWFVDFEFPNEKGKPYKSSDGAMVDSDFGMIPGGWKISNFSEIATFKNGKAIKQSLRNEEGRNNIFGANGIIGHTNEILTETPCLIIGRVGAYCGSIQRTLTSSWTTDNAIICLPKECYYYSYIYYSLLKSSLREKAGGSAQPLLNQGLLNSTRTVIPCSNVVKMFDKVILSMLKTIENNIIENKKLAEIRDAILPKLMSGEIRVPVEEQ
ncbi:restriction endonuclease subunit S [Peribacillus sp. FSL K6-1552]|uniref:restriction endonuclease subunit S n=1 Tax=Peribacillus sp. FSL K6-1552 TaxID=2954514 RepID=UPI0030F77C3D